MLTIAELVGCGTKIGALRLLRVVLIEMLKARTPALRTCPRILSTATDQGLALDEEYWTHRGLYSLSTKQ